MLANKPRIDKMVTLIKKYHAGQTRSPSNIPYWHHLVSVAEILQQALLDNKELKSSSSLFDDLILTALGHDLYEDTTILPKLIDQEFGTRVNDLIQLMTNRKGDHDRATYVKQIAAAPEEVKLIKLADLTENTLSASQRLHELGTKWATTFFLPIIEEMSPKVKPSEFVTYPKTAADLWQKYTFAYTRLADNTKKHQS